MRKVWKVNGIDVRVADMSTEAIEHLLKGEYKRIEPLRFEIARRKANERENAPEPAHDGGKRFEGTACARGCGGCGRCL